MHFAHKNGGFVLEYLHPKSVECMRMVHKICKRTWESFVQKESVGGLLGHIFPFPIYVLKDDSLDEEDGIFFLVRKMTTKKSYMLHKLM